MTIPVNVKAIIDLTLGDGYIGYGSGVKSQDNANPHLSFTHSLAQTEYVTFKAEYLRSFGFTVTERTYQIKSGKNIDKWYHTAYVRRTPVIKTAMKWTYNKGRKAIDKALLRQLDAQSLAFWYMDDGTTKFARYNQKESVRYVYETPKATSYVFCTDNFTYAECELFSAYLKEVFGISSTLTRHSSKTNFWRVYINQINSKDLFRELMLPYIIPSMLYKFQYPHTFHDIPFTIVPRA